MNDIAIPDLLLRHEIPGRVTITRGNGNLPKVNVTASRSTAEAYLHGAHVTAFQKNGEPPLLFMSQASWFAEGKPIRGGVPIIFPWFGPRDGAPAHGFARLADWDLAEAHATAEGDVELRFDLPESVTKTNAVNARISFVVTVGDKLGMELTVTNGSTRENLSFENCLHTYFAVGDINAVSITGLKGVSYLDRLDNLSRKLESSDAIRINPEVDRTYLDTAVTVEIHDAKLRRKIRIEKSGSASTVVWNPWIAKSKAMPDFGDEEYKQVVCVESGNVAQNRITLAPGKSTALKVILSTEPS